MNKKTIVTILKFAISFGIIGYLAYISQDQIAKLKDTEFEWKFLFLATLIALSGVCVTFYRWYLLVIALEIPFKIKDGFRLGFLGYLFNFVSLGSIGGDFFKAFFIAREQPNHRHHAVLTVLVDRAIGLLGMFLMVTIATFLTDFTSQVTEENQKILTLIQISWYCSGIGIVGLILLQFPWFTEGWFAKFLTKIRFVGPIIGKLLHAFQLYRKCPLIIFASVVLSVSTHLLFSLAFYFISQGLQMGHIAWTTHMIAVPLAMIAAVVPLPGGGLGALEGALNYLYSIIPNTPPIPKGPGFIIAIVYRIITVVIATIGVFYYLASRSEVDKIMQEAQQEQEKLEAESSSEEDSETKSESEPSS